MTGKNKKSTIAVQSGLGRDTQFNAVIPPLHLSSTNQMHGLNKFPDYQYSRVRNPSRDILVETLAELEEGYSATVTASGMAAIALFLQLLKPDDLLMAPYDCYGRAYRLMSALSEKGHFKLEFINQYDPKARDQALAKGPAMVFVETPSNPLMRIADIAAISKNAKAANPNCLIVCDNTFLSPVLQTPLTLGADLVNESTTKFLNGHSDVVGGAVIAKTKALWEELDFWANSMGLIGAPFDSYLTMRGIRTLALRVERAQDNAGKIAAFLNGHAKVSEVYYPGLEDHPGHEIAARQQKGFGAMISFRIKGGLEDMARFTDTLGIFRLAQSLGGTESLINHPATMTHVSMGPEAREKAGVTDSLLRISAGIEDVDDLLADLGQALDKI